MKRNPRRRAGVGTGSTPATIGFRLDEPNRRLLAERAHQLGVSPHELARHEVINALRQGDGLAELAEAVVTLEATLRQLREDVATVAEALLVSAGHVPPDQAREWVQTNLK
jgi:hypothetical protein